MREKNPYLEFSESIFFSIWTECGVIGVSLCIQYECEKIRTRKTPNVNPFHALIVSNGFLFLEEIHPTVNDYIKWKDDFKDGVFYSHGKSNSCVVLICFIRSKKLFARNKLSGDDCHILILDVDIDDENFILIKFYNPNTKAEQLKTLSKPMEMLNKLHLTQNNNIICVRDFDFLFNVKLENYGGNAVFKKTFCRKNI